MNCSILLSTLRYPIALLLWYTMISCVDDVSLQNVPVQGSFESTATADQGQIVVYESEDKFFSIEVISIKDSRCPSDVVCIWAGIAQVTFSISGIAQPIDLFFGSGSRADRTIYTFVFEGHPYELAIVDVTPYPTTKNFQSLRKAHFNVRPL